MISVHVQNSFLLCCWVESLFDAHGCILARSVVKCRCKQWRNSSPSLKQGVFFRRRIKCVPESTGSPASHTLRHALSYFHSPGESDSIDDAFKPAPLTWRHRILHPSEKMSDQDLSSSVVITSPVSLSYSISSSSSSEPSAISSSVNSSPTESSVKVSSLRIE